MGAVMDGVRAKPPDAFKNGAFVGITLVCQREGDCLAEGVVTDNGTDVLVLDLASLG